MNPRKQWTKEECGNLIEMYRQHTNLWDTKSIDYKNRNKRQDSLKEIANCFDTVSDEVERKIKNLMSQYKRERRKYKCMKKAGAGHAFVSKWFGYEFMRFLHDKIKPSPSPRKGGSNLDTEDSDSSSDSDSSLSLNGTQSTTYDENLNLEEESSEGRPEIETMPLKIDYSFTVPKVTTEKPSASCIRIRQRQRQREEAIAMMTSVYNDERKTTSTSTRDEYEVFGELVGRKVRSLKTDYAKATVQHLINNILYEAAVGKYDAPTTSYNSM